MIDITMPGLNGLDAAVQMVKRFPGTRIIILSMHTNEEYVMQALQSGVAGYLLKDVSAGELIQAAKLALEGKAVIHPSLTRAFIEEFEHIAADHPVFRIVPTPEPR